MFCLHYGSSHILLIEMSVSVCFNKHIMSADDSEMKGHNTDYIWDLQCVIGEVIG